MLSLSPAVVRRRLLSALQAPGEASQRRRGGLKRALKVEGSVYTVPGTTRVLVFPGVDERVSCRRFGPFLFRVGEVGVGWRGSRRAWEQ